MKILSINILYEPYIGGGAETIVKDLCSGLLKRGYNVSVLTFHEKENTNEIIDGINVFRVKIPNFYLPYFQGTNRPNAIKRFLWHLVDVYNPVSRKIVKQYLNIIKPDVIIVHNIAGWSPSIWETISKYKVPIIQVLHDSYLLCPRNMFSKGKICKKQCIKCKVMRFPHKILSNKTTAVVGVSNFILNHLLSYGYFSKTKIKTVIYNSRKIDNTNISLKNHNGNIHFGFIGTIAPNKGIEVLLKAYKNINIANSKLIIAGDGEKKYVEYLKSKYKDERIKWLGKVRPVDFFSQVDVSIVPSIWYENLPGVIIESFSFGIPVIGSNIGGISEMVVDKNNGMLFNPYNSGELEEKMALFASNIKYWREKNKDIKNTALKFLDSDAWINQWEQLLKLVVK